MQSAESRLDDAFLSVAAIVASTGLPLRTIQRRVQKWHARQWPRVRREVRRGDPRGTYLVNALDWERYCAGEGPVQEERAA